VIEFHLPIIFDGDEIMTTSTQAVSSSQPLPMEPKDCITEWTGQRGYDLIHAAITTAEPPLTRNVVGIVMQYLKKSDLFGLERVETAAGGKEELTKLVGKYNPETPLPLEIDDFMQAPLSKYFNEETLKAFPNIRKVTELYSLYWCPKGITANNAELFAKKHGTGFSCFYPDARQEHGNSATSVDCWIAFPNDVFGRGKAAQQQEALIPAGFEFPYLKDTIFCVFMRYACTGVRIMTDYPWTYTRCQEQTQDYKLIVGFFGAGGLSVRYSNFDSEFGGVAPVRKFC
jgi:hypothetical protein